MRLLEDILNILIDEISCVVIFQDRFRSIIIEDGDYPKRLVRYIHLNPVRTGLVDMPKDYPWSSFCAYLVINEITWLTQSRILPNKP